MRRRADTPQRGHRERVQEPELVGRIDDHHAASGPGPGRRSPGLGRLRRQLGQELHPGHPDRTGQALLVEHPLSDRPGDRRAVAVEAPDPGDVEERLVEGDRLDQRGQVAEDRHHPGAHVPVVGVVTGQEHGIGAEPTGPHRRHRRSARRGLGPRSWPQRRRRAPPSHRRPPDGPAAPVGAGAPPRRRTRPCRRGGSPGPGARRPWSGEGVDLQRREVATPDPVAEVAVSPSTAPSSQAWNGSRTQGGEADRWSPHRSAATQRASTTMPSGSSITRSPVTARASWTSTVSSHPRSTASASIR